MSHGKFPDPFLHARTNGGVCPMNDQNDPVTMVLRHRDVRKSAHDWKTFQSGAEPGRIVIPSEVNIRDVRQIPFELDPPLHTEYRALVEAWFKRPNDEDYAAALTAQIEAAVEAALNKGVVEVVSQFSLPLQSRALTLLLNISANEAETWIGWGTHVFRSEGEALDGDKANILYDYIDRQIDKAAAAPGTDLYSVLLASEARGRKLTKEEVKGVMILTFAGGRDTVINAVTNAVAYFSDHPETLTRLRADPELINNAVEELIRYFAPLTHMGRVVTTDATVCEHAVEADSRISLCWASANRDEAVFDRPNEVIIDRKANPHLSFGFGRHNCLGATHARQLMRILLRVLAEKVETIEVSGAEENLEEWGDITRKVGFHALNATFHGRS